MVETAVLLKRIPLFRGLGETELSHLADRAQRRVVAAKTEVIQQGEEGSTVFAVLSGRFKVERTRGAETIVLDVLGPGQVFGELALLTGGVRTASVVSLEPCEILSIDQRDLLFLLDGRSDLALTFLRSTASRIIGLSQVVEELHTLCLGPRLASRVCAIAEEHGNQKAKSLVVDLRLTQGDWAHLTGTNREAVNRQFRAWEKEGWMRVQGQRLLIDDLEALRAVGDLAGFVY